MIFPAVLALAAYRNGYAEYDLTLTDQTTGGALDLTGCTAEMQVRAAPGAPGEPMLSISSDAPTPNESGITFTDRIHGKLQILVRQADFEAFPAVPPQGTKFSYDLLIQAPGFDPAPFVRGPFNFSDGVTREGLE